MLSPRRKPPLNGLPLNFKEFRAQDKGLQAQQKIYMYTTKHLQEHNNISTKTQQDIYKNTTKNLHSLLRPSIFKSLLDDF